ncbi:MAG: site-2 protease family protein [Planctomycetes bacterium]|nr:site-2 protease family protein [Planctomycetota bacterium]
MDNPAPAGVTPLCPDCGTQLAPGLLACPSCLRLIHAARLKQLAADAAAARSGGDLAGALAAWRAALELLPADTTQHHAVTGTIAALSREVESAPARPRPPAPSPFPAVAQEGRGGGRSAPPSPPAPSPVTSPAAGANRPVITGPIGGVLAAAALFLLTKAKFLLLGVSKAAPALSVLLSFAVYWNFWGWKFAAGLIASIYVHELGHIAMLRRYGFAASAPMFIPGIGAFVRLHQRPVSAREDARVGLAGPTWGLAAALGALLLYRLTADPLWCAVAKTGAWINLFNLIPIWQLDGGRGFASLNRWERGLVTLAALSAWYFTQDGLLILLVICGGLRTAGAGAPAASDAPNLLRYLVLLAALAALAALHVPGVKPF